MYGLYPDFRARAPWWSSDLQTIRNALRGPKLAADREPAERLVLPLRDGSGDRLAALLQRPMAPRRPAAPTVVLIHGLGGDETSSYMQASAAHWLARGYPVLRLNLRGAGASRETCRLQYHAGRSSDLRDALAAFADQAPELASRGALLVGYSLGGNLVLKMLGELGGDGSAGVALRGAATVSAPIDLQLASRRFLERRNRFYHWYMLQGLKKEATAPGAESSAVERRAIERARTLWEFDEHFVAPRNGFDGARDYYEKSSSVHLLDAIRVPTLAVHAADDPWIPARSYTERRWSQDAGVRLLLARGGGHVGFHARGDAVPWHDRCIAAFFEREAG